MKFLITGGAGFIGSNFCHYVVNKYPEDIFICLDALTYAGNFNNIKSLTSKPNFKFIHGDITNSDFIDTLFDKEKFDIVINFAAESHVDNSIKNPVIFSKAMKNEKIPIYGTGKNVRDWIHVHDHNVGVDLIVRNGRVGEIYNLGGHSEKNNN